MGHAVTVRTTLTPEQKRRAEQRKQGIWPGPPKKQATPGASGKAEAEKRFGK